MTTIAQPLDVLAVQARILEQQARDLRLQARIALGIHPAASDLAIGYLSSACLLLGQCAAVLQMEHESASASAVKS